MKAYFTYFKLKFISGLQYRSAAWAGIATQFFFGFVYIMVYIAFYESGGKDIPMTLSQTITYLWLNQALLALVNQFTRDEELFKMVKEGTISYELARPKNLYFMWYFKILGQKLSGVALRFLPLIIVTSLLPYPYGLGLPVSCISFIVFLLLPVPIDEINFIFFLLSLTIGSLLVTSLTVLYPIVALTKKKKKGIVNLIITTADILSGVVVPIPFFPLFLQKISRVLPFQYISDLPFRIYVGNIHINSCIIPILIQITWLILLIILGNVLMKKSLKRVVVQGG